MNGTEENTLEAAVAKLAALQTERDDLIASIAAGKMRLEELEGGSFVGYGHPRKPGLIAEAKAHIADFGKPTVQLTNGEVRIVVKVTPHRIYLRKRGAPDSEARYTDRDGKSRWWHDIVPEQAQRLKPPPHYKS